MFGLLFCLRDLSYGVSLSHRNDYIIIVNDVGGLGTEALLVYWFSFVEVTSGDPEPGFSFGLSSIAVSSVSLFSMRHTFEVL